ncbi:MAG: hypothetical protein V3U72_00770 [Candidatus Aenigmarchaeota archaeon]
MKKNLLSGFAILAFFLIINYTSAPGVYCGNGLCENVGVTLTGGDVSTFKIFEEEHTVELLGFSGNYTKAIINLDGAVKEVEEGKWYTIAGVTVKVDDITTIYFGASQEITGLMLTFGEFHESCPDDCGEGLCEDSDGGKDYYTAGRVQWENGSNLDICKSDFILKENYCYQGPKSEEYECEIGCESGACIPECTTKEDCPSENEGEHYCKNSDRCIIVTHYNCIERECVVAGGGELCQICPNGCEDGVCKSQNQTKRGYIVKRIEDNVDEVFPVDYIPGDDPFALCNVVGTGTVCYGIAEYSDDVGQCSIGDTGYAIFSKASCPDICTDTDGGKDYYVKGVREIISGDVVSVSYDKCDGDRLTEYYCYGNEGVVGVYDCPNGCRDGACVKSGKCPEKIDMDFNKYDYYPGDYFEVTVEIYDSYGNLMPNQVFNIYNAREGQTSTYYTDSNGVYKEGSTIPSGPEYEGEWTFVASVSEEECPYISDKETLYIHISTKCGDGFCDEDEKELVCETLCYACPVEPLPESVEARTPVGSTSAVVTGTASTQQVATTATKTSGCGGCTAYCHVKCSEDCTPNCGNGVCDIATCEALGCPIPENEKNCPADCKEANYCGSQSSDPGCICETGYRKEKFEAPCLEEAEEGIEVPVTTTGTTKGYRNAYWQCYDGEESYEGGKTSCKSSETWKKYAEDFCSGHCSDYGKCGVNSFSVWNECGGTSEMCTYYRCVPSYNYLYLYTDKYAYDINERVEIYTNSFETGDLRVEEIKVSVSNPYGTSEVVILRPDCDIGECPVCAPGLYCPPCKTYTTCRYTGTFTGTDAVGLYNVGSVSEGGDMIIHPTSFRVYDSSLLEKYLILKDIDGYKYMDAQFYPGPANSMGYMALYEKDNRQYATIVYDFETREELEKALKQIFSESQYSPSEEKIGDYYIYVIKSYGQKVYFWTYKTFLIAVLGDMPYYTTATAVRAVESVSATTAIQPSVSEVEIAIKEEVAVKESDFLTGMVITGMPLADKPSVYCGMDSVQPRCTCKGDEAKEEFTPPCMGGVCETHYRCMPPHPKQLLVAYLDKYPSDIKAEGTECEQKGGYCIHFEKSCRSGFEETGFACKTNSEKCCVKEVDRDDFLEMVMKLEGIRVKMDKLEKQSKALAEYYDSVGDAERAKKFREVADKFAHAKDMIDDIVAKIRENLDNLEGIRSEIKEDVYELRTYISSILEKMVS